MFNSNIKSVFLTVLVALAANGVLFLNLNTASADEFRAKPGDTVEVNDGDTVVVEVPKSKTKVKLGESHHDDVSVVVVPTPQAPQVVVVDDDFSSPAAVSVLPDDPTSSVELSMRAILTPSSPAIGGTLGFSYKPANRLRLYMGVNVAKGTLDLVGAEQELVAFGFTAGASKLLTRTVEVGVFGTATWSYRDITHKVSTSFLGAGPGFRLNKGGAFFETSLQVGWDKKFSTSPWEFGSTVVCGIGIKF